MRVRRADQRSSGGRRRGRGNAVGHARPAEIARKVERDGTHFVQRANSAGLLAGFLLGVATDLILVAAGG
jgi:hypothetical protein